MEMRRLLIPVFPIPAGPIVTAGASIRAIASCEVSMVVAQRRPGETSETDWEWGVATTPVGLCTMVWCDQALTYLGFPEAALVESWVQSIRERWSLETLTREDDRAQNAVGPLFFGQDQSEPLIIQLDGTAFQIAVWDGLLSIPPGSTTTYAALAQTIGRPTAVRACANAVGDNPISWLFPCHRVVRSDGTLGGYRWGVEMKSTMLEAEAWARSV
jgi:AraC family transcriptional regulator, regulatory protein of adaptative response / methylated-DNA-[protein]-cysteine methyltransferase